MEDKIKILLVDDHDLIREGLKRILNFEEDFMVIGEGRNGKEAVNLCQSYQPEVVVLDINMPLLDGIEVLRKIKEKYSNIKVIILTVENDKSKLKEAIDLGADGYILKDSAGTEITDAIRNVYRGEKYLDQGLVKSLFFHIQNQGKSEANLLITLTIREAQILYKISQGLSNKAIANELYLSEKTIKNYATKIFRKLNVEDRVQATIYALKNNIQDFVEGE